MSNLVALFEKVLCTPELHSRGDFFIFRANAVRAVTDLVSARSIVIGLIISRTQLAWCRDARHLLH